MAVDKLKVITTGNTYSNNVCKAQYACSDAADALKIARATISTYWQGEAGDAMVEALNRLGAEINQISWDLSNLERQLRGHINGIRESWEEEIPEP